MQGIFGQYYYTVRVATATALVVFPLSSVGLNANASHRLTGQMQGKRKGDTGRQGREKTLIPYSQVA